MRPAPLPQNLPQRAFSIDAARALGVHDERLRRSDLVTPTRGLRWRVGSEPEGIDRIRAHRPVLRPGQFISHTSAALLWDLPLPWALEQSPTVHVTSIAPRNAMARAGVVGHVVSAPAPVRMRWGMPTSSPARTWIDCATLLGLDDLIALGDAIVTSRACDTSIDDLRAAIAEHVGGRGMRKLRIAIEFVRVGPGSRRETFGRLMIVRGGLPEPELQVSIHDRRGRFLGRVDMAYPEQRVVVEYEGDHHRTDPDQWAIDIERYRRLENEGWSTFRCTKHDLGREPTLDQLADRLGITRTR